MANTHPQNKGQNLVKLFLAFLVLILVFVFFNDSAYNLIKQKLIKNGDKYAEIYAYAKSKPDSENKYFILQGNDLSKIFLKNEVKTIDENHLSNINCSQGETLLIYEKPSQKIDAFVKKENGNEVILNQGTKIEFFAANIKGSPGSCKVGG